MILIADSGSTKTAWRGVAQDIRQWEGKGINPLHLSDEEIAAILDETFSSGAPKVSEIHFYGAGCVEGSPVERLERILSDYFSASKIHVADDMLAVARGVCGHDPGIACILGTGANSCYYDGSKITFKVPALGFILGDEGSGAWLGKMLMGAYYREELSPGLRQQLEKRFDMKREHVLNAVYQAERPAAYLAGYSKFIFQHRDDPFIYRMIYDGFGMFLDKNVCKYEGYLELPVHFSGSVAYFYSTILRKACSDRGIRVGNIVEGPIAGLALYHQS